MRLTQIRKPLIWITHIMKNGNNLIKEKELLKNKYPFTKYGRIRSYPIKPQPTQGPTGPDETKCRNEGTIGN